MVYFWSGCLLHRNEDLAGILVEGVLKHCLTSDFLKLKLATSLERSKHNVDQLLIHVYATHNFNLTICLYSKVCLKRPLKIDKTKVLKTNGNLMKVESIAECSSWSILQYF